MLSTVDLHTHSNYSDGSSTPAELIRHAAALNLCAIALTDHDTADGHAEARTACEEYGISFIPGIELSSRCFEREIHILGYYCRFDDPDFLSALNELQRRRDEKNQNIISLMQKDGIPITLEDITSDAHQVMITRAHFARWLMERGYAYSISDAFDRLIGEGKRYYAAKTPFPSVEAVQLIRNAGGVAVLAHPGLARLSDFRLDQLVLKLKAAGLQGIEAYHSRHSREDTAIALELAERYELLVTGGSDYHAKNKPDIELGVGPGNLCLTEKLWKDLEQFHQNGSPE